MKEANNNLIYALHIFFCFVKYCKTGKCPKLRKIWRAHVNATTFSERTIIITRTENTAKEEEEQKQKHKRNTKRQQGKVLGIPTHKIRETATQDILQNARGTRSATTGRMAPRNPRIVYGATQVRQRRLCVGDVSNTHKRKTEGTATTATKDDNAEQSTRSRD